MFRLLVAAGALAFALGAAGNATAQTASIINAKALESDDTIDFTVGLSGALGADVVFSVTYEAGSVALDDILQSNRPDRVMVEGGSTIGKLEVPIIDNLDLVRDGTFRVTIARESGAAVRVAGATAEGTISAEVPVPVTNDATVSIDNASEAEEGSAIRFTVRLSAMVNSNVVLDLDYASGSTSGATLAEDLGTRPGTVTIRPGNTSATFDVPTIQDQDDEGNEIFTVTISEIASSDRLRLPEGVEIAAGRATATGTIIDNDAPPVATPTVSIAPVTVAEDVSGGNAVFTVTLSAAVDRAVTLDVAVTAGSTNPATVSGAGADLGTLPPATVTIPQGSLTADITVPIVDDDIAGEGNETFTVTISDADSSLDGVVTISGGGTATGTIRDDDAPPVATTPTVGIAPVTVAEDVSGGNAVFTVILSAAADRAVTLDVAVTAGSTNPATVSGAGADLGTLPPATVTIPQGSLTATITVPIVDDDIADEGNETFTVTISDTDNSLDGVVTISGGGTATGTIADDDSTTPPTPDITVSVRDAEAREGADLSFKVRLSRALGSDLEVCYELRQPFGATGPLARVNPFGEDEEPLDVRLPDANGSSVTISAGMTEGNIVIQTLRDGDDEEGEETFEVAIFSPPPFGCGAPPDGVTVSRGVAKGTILDDDPSTAPTDDSDLVELRDTGAGTALRRHAGRFDSLTGTVVRNRLDVRATRRLSASENAGDGAAAAGGGLGETRWGAWIDGAWAGFDGKASGRQADVYGGVDYQAGDWLIGALIGYETADLDIDKATYRSDYTQFGVYGGARVSERLLFDGAATYGTATPDIAQGTVTASYDASRLTVRGALTGDLGIGYGHGLKVQPRLGLLYSREQLDEFTDSAGGSVGGETLKLGRFSAGPRLTWEFDGGQVAGGVRAQWDFLELDDGVDNRISGAADIGVNLDLTPNVVLGVQGDIDGIGTSGDFGSLGGRVKLDVRF